MSDGIPFFFTAAQKAALSALGYTAAQIAEMAPAQAHEILKVNGQPVASAQPGVEINPPGRNRLSAVDAARIDFWMLELAQAARGGMREESMRLAVRGEPGLDRSFERSVFRFLCRPGRSRRARFAQPLARQR